MKKLRKLTLAALLTAAGLVVFVIEAQLPPLAAIPGIKPGLSNVFTMLTLFWVGPSWALGTMFVRVSLGCLLTGQTMAFFYSFSGVFHYVGAQKAAGRGEALGAQRVRRDGTQPRADGGGAVYHPHDGTFVLSSGSDGFRHRDRDIYRPLRAAGFPARAAGGFSQ